jgi:hypothetical protein
VPTSAAEPRLPKTATTAVYMNKAGVKYAVYHWSKSAQWQHKNTAKDMRGCPVCVNRGRKVAFR